MTYNTEPFEHAQSPHPLYYDAIAQGPVRAIMALYGLEHRGAEVLGQIDGPAIIAPAHRSMLDIPAVARAAKEGADTQIHFMAKHTLWNLPVIGGLVGRIIDYGGSFAIDRTDKTEMPAKTAEHVGSLLTKGAVICLYPEMERRKDPDPLTGGDPQITTRDIHGAPHLSAAFQVPIVPVGISGTRKGDRRPVRVVFGEVMPPPPVVGTTIKRAAVGMRRELAVRMQEVQDEAITWRESTRRR